MGIFDSKMAQVEKSSVHVKVLDNEAIDSKKTLLELQLLSLNTLRNLIVIRELREQEFRLKKEARLRMQDISRLIKDILAIFPVLEQLKISKGIEGFNLPAYEERHEPLGEAKKKQPKEKKKKPKKDKKTRLDEELEAIKKKLAGLQ